jgi:hemerythrin
MKNIFSNEKDEKNEKNEDTIPADLMKQSVYIIWKPEYNLGIPIIDEQHRGIVTTINTMFFGMQNYDFDNINDLLVPVVELIKNYTLVHFQIEEAFYLKGGYPNAQSHRDQHCALVDKLSGIAHKSILDRDAYPFMAFLKTWWINHICNEDLAYRDYLLTLEETQT